MISHFVSQINEHTLSSYLSITSNMYVAIIVGIILSLTFQSSSVVTGIVLAVAGTGNIDLAQSVGLILGANIGTTSTVVIVSLAMGREAKKIAFSHFLFNFLGVLFFIPFLKYFYQIVEWLDGGLVRQIANIHLIFNLSCSVLFLSLIRPFYILVNKIIE